MFNLLDFIYYRIYNFFLKAQGQKDGAMIAMITLWVLLGANVLTVIALLEAFQILPIINKSKIYLYILAVLILLFCIKRFWVNKQYIEIENKFKIESKKKKIKGALLIWLYIVLTILLLSFVSMLRYNLIHYGGMMEF